MVIIVENTFVDYFRKHTENKKHSEILLILSILS